METRDLELSSDCILEFCYWFIFFQNSHLKMGMSVDHKNECWKTTNKQSVSCLLEACQRLTRKVFHFHSRCGCRVEESGKLTTLARQRAHTRWVKDINLKKSQKKLRIMVTRWNFFTVKQWIMIYLMCDLYFWLWPYIAAINVKNSSYVNKWICFIQMAITAKPFWRL